RPATAGRTSVAASACSMRADIAALPGRELMHYFASQSWSIRMYHCGFHWYPCTFFDRKSICFGLNRSTQGAWSVTAWSACAQMLLACVGLLWPRVRALSIWPWIDLSQNAAMFGLASLCGWMLPHPSSTLRKSDAVG